MTDENDPNEVENTNPTNEGEDNAEELSQESDDGRSADSSSSEEEQDGEGRTADGSETEEEGEEEVNPNDDLALEAAALLEMKNRAKTLGVKFHPSIKADSLSVKIRDHIDKQARSSKIISDEQVTDNAVNASQTNKIVEEKINELDDNDADQAELKAKLRARQEATKMVRIIISSMDPSRSEHKGELISVGNSVIGNITKFIPYETEWHVENIVYLALKEKKYRQTVRKKEGQGRITQSSRLVQALSIQLLAPLTEAELKELKRQQALLDSEAA